MTDYYRRAFSLTSVYLAGTLAERSLAFALLPVYTAYLTPADFGVFSLLVLASTLANYFVVSPLSVGLQRFYEAPQFAHRRDSLLAGLFTILLAKATLVGLAYLILVKVACRFLHMEAARLDAIHWYAVVVFLIPFPILSSTLLQLQQRAKYLTASSLVSHLLGISLSLYLLVSRDMGLVSLVFGQMVHQLVLMAFTYPWYFVSARWRLSWQAIAEPLRFGYSLLPAAYSDWVVQFGDRYLLAFFSGTRAVGLYDVGYRLSSVVSLALVEPMKRGIQPLIFKLESDPAAQKDFVRVTANHFCLAGTCLALGISLFAKEIVGLLASGDAFWEAWTIMPVICFAYVLHGLGNFFNCGVVMAKRTGIIAVNVLIAAGSNIVLNCLLIPRFGILGAAFATLLSYALWDCLKMYHSKRLYGLEFDVRRLACMLVVSGTLCLVVIGLAEHAPISSLGVFLLKLAALAAYLPLLWVLGAVARGKAAITSAARADEEPDAVAVISLPLND